MAGGFYQCGRGARQEKFRELDWLQLSAPKLFGREARAFGHRFELCPGYLRVANTRSEATVRSRHNVFAANDLRITHETVSDGLRVLDDIRRMPDNAR